MKELSNIDHKSTVYLTSQFIEVSIVCPRVLCKIVAIGYGNASFTI